MSLNRFHRRPALTLMELLLALSLSILVLMAVAMAINLHFKMLDVRRTNVEESQVVRAVAKFIADDLRGSLSPTQQDLSGLEVALKNAMQAVTAQATSAAAGGASGTTNIGAAIANAAGGGNNPGGISGSTQVNTGQTPAGSGQGQGQGKTTGNTGGQGNNQGGQGNQSGGAQGSAASGGQASGSGGTGSSSSQSTGSTDSTATPAAAVKLVGSSYELRVDISRLPRVDQYKASQASSKLGAVTTQPSDIKTITYFLSADTSGSAGGSSGPAEPSTDGTGRGLMRSEMDRVLAAWEETNGSTTAAYDNAKLIAKEVTGLEFEYFDGTEWLYEWDSSTSGLPRAIKIILTVQPLYALNEHDLAKSAARGTPPPEQTFKYVVAIPAAPLYKVEEPTTTTDTSSSTTGTSSTSSPAQGTMP